MVLQHLNTPLLLACALASIYAYMEAGASAGVFSCMSSSGNGMYAALRVFYPSSHEVCMLWDVPVPRVKQHSCIKCKSECGGCAIVRITFHLCCRQ